MKMKKSFLSKFRKLFQDRGMTEGFESVLSLLSLFIISFVYFYFFGRGIFFVQENNCFLFFQLIIFRNLLINRVGFSIMSPIF